MTVDFKPKRIQINVDTLLKQMPLQSTDPNVGEMHLIKAKTMLSVRWSQEVLGHLYFELDEAFLGRFNWYVFLGHITVIGNEPDNLPVQQNEQNPIKPLKGKFFVVPTKDGKGKRVQTDQPIFPGAFFTWGEATSNGSRIPETWEITENIEKLAYELQKLRLHLGTPLRVNSWYRPPHVNKAVGGASKSMHLTGLAVDISIKGDVRTIWAKVSKYWGIKGGCAHAFGSRGNFIHLDLRGYRATWAY